MEIALATMEQAAKVLHHIVTSPAVKLEWGRHRRLQDRALIARGLPAEGYRVEWLRETRGMVVEVLSAQAKAFAAKYPHDLISVRDFFDVLLNIQYLLEKKASKRVAETT